MLTVFEQYPKRKYFSSPSIKLNACNKNEHRDWCILNIELNTKQNKSVLMPNICGSKVHAKRFKRVREIILMF